MKELKVSAIKDGTVIDHIPGDVVFKVVDVLSLETVSYTHLTLPTILLV